MEQHVTQVATYVGQLDSQGKLLRQTINNPKHNVSVIYLRNAKCYEAPSITRPKEEAENSTEEILGKKEAKKEVEKETPRLIK